MNPEDAELLRARNFGHLATLLADGSPHVTPVWVDYRDGLVWVNTSEDRVKYQNVRRDPRVALSLIAQEDPYRAFILRGRVVETTREGAVEHINWLARKYLGHDFPEIPGQVRVILKIRPDRVTG